MRCINCENEIADGSTICWHCWKDPNVRQPEEAEASQTLLWPENESKPQVETQTEQGPQLESQSEQGLQPVTPVTLELPPPTTATPESTSPRHSVNPRLPITIEQKSPAPQKPSARKTPISTWTWGMVITLAAMILVLCGCCSYCANLYLS
ncbi:MAG: hypothetical protein LBU61_03885 [Coriobacteriales bacterium]|nr:hypothetical protein [Coriobacteriales bacterium]